MALRVAVMVIALGASAIATRELVERGRSADARRRVIESAPMARGWLRLRDGSELDRTVLPNACERTETGYSIADRFWYESPGVRLTVATKSGKLESLRVEGPELREPLSVVAADCGVFELEDKDAAGDPRFGTAATELRVDCSVGPRRVSAYVKALNCGSERPPESWHRRVFAFPGAT